MLAASADVTPLLSDMMGYDKVKVSRLESVGRDHVKENLETAGKVKKKRQILLMHETRLSWFHV